jgi:hypothetical protein
MIFNDILVMIFISTNYEFVGLHELSILYILFSSISVIEKVIDFESLLHNVYKSHGLQEHLMLFYDGKAFYKLPYPYYTFLYRS